MRFTGTGPSWTVGGWSWSASRKSARGGRRYVFAGTPVEQRVSCPNGLKRGCSLLSVASRSSQCSHFGALSSSISGVEVCSLWFGALLAGQVWQFRAERRLAGQDSGSQRAKSTGWRFFSGSPGRRLRPTAQSGRTADSHGTFASLTAVGHRSSRQTLRCSESVKVWTGLARGVWALRYSHYSTLSGTVAEGQRVRIAFWLCSVLTSGTRVLISSEHLAVTTARAVCLVQD